MASSDPSNLSQLDEHDDGEDILLDADEAEEEIAPDGDHPMGSDDELEDGDYGEGENLEIDLRNDSIGHFDRHTDSLFAIATHPLDPTIVATGSGDDTVYVFSTASTPSSAPLLPTSYESNPRPKGARESLAPLAHLSGHTDSVAALSFSLPHGEYLLTAGLDGRVRAYQVPPPQNAVAASGDAEYKFLGQVQEIEEVCWLQACNHPAHPNTFALGAADGSVWVYSVEGNSETPLQIIQTYYQHTAPSTAGTWSPSGSLLASVSEEGSLYVYDPFGDAAAAGVAASTGQALIGLTPDDQRFSVDGGLYSIAISPSGAFLAAGGSGGVIRIVGLPILGSSAETANVTKSQKGAGSRSKAGGSKQSPSVSSGQAGQILASLQAQTDSVETLSFSAPPLTLLAAGSVDSSIALYDTAHRFAVRRLIREAHEDQAVVQVSFAQPSASAVAGNLNSSGGSSGRNENWILTSCGIDGVVRRWDTRGGTAATGMGLIKEWHGHRGGEAGGVMGFVEGAGKITTIGDDGISLVFDAESL